MGNIHNYDHPFVTVDGVIFRYVNSFVEVLLVKRTNEPELGRWGLPGGFVDIDKRLEDTLHAKVSQKTGVSGFFAEQLMTYDSFKRDPRGRVLTVAYLGLTNDIDDTGDWFQIRCNRLVKHTKRGEELTPEFYDEAAESLAFSDLAFDHGNIIHDALKRLGGKLWYSDLPRHILPKEFTIREATRLYEILEGHYTKNFTRKIERYVEGTGTFSKSFGRPAELFRWKGAD